MILSPFFGRGICYVPMYSVLILVDRAAPSRLVKPCSLSRHPRTLHPKKGERITQTGGLRPAATGKSRSLQRPSERSEEGGDPDVFYTLAVKKEKIQTSSIHPRKVPVTREGFDHLGHIVAPLPLRLDTCRRTIGDCAGWLHPSPRLHDPLDFDRISIPLRAC